MSAALWKMENCFLWCMWELFGYVDCHESFPAVAYENVVINIRKSWTS